ncbi:hypothetical protein ANO11243_093760 [Dothideomycetidae sp. 11243]|nr:hypothetical protein ANO11243_093760 [fungal sp. No.11243]
MLHHLCTISSAVLICNRPRSTSPVPGVTAENLLDGCACFDKSVSSGKPGASHTSRHPHKPARSTTTTTDQPQETVTVSEVDASHTYVSNTGISTSVTTDGYGFSLTDVGEIQTSTTSSTTQPKSVSLPITTTGTTTCANPASSITIASVEPGGQVTFFRTWTLGLNAKGTILSGSPTVNTTFASTLNATDAATSCVSFIDKEFEKMPFAADSAGVYQDENLGDAWHCIAHDNNSKQQFSNSSFIADDFAECSYGYVIARSSFNVRIDCPLFTLTRPSEPRVGPDCAITTRSILAGPKLGRFAGCKVPKRRCEDKVSWPEMRPVGQDYRCGSLVGGHNLSARHHAHHGNNFLGDIYRVFLGSTTHALSPPSGRYDIETDLRMHLGRREHPDPSSSPSPDPKRSQLSVFSLLQREIREGVAAQLLRAEAVLRLLRCIVSHLPGQDLMMLIRVSPRTTSPVPGITTENLLDGCACFHRHSPSHTTGLSETITTGTEQPETTSTTSNLDESSFVTEGEQAATTDVATATSFTTEPSQAVSLTTIPASSSGATSDSSTSSSTTTSITSSTTTTTTMSPTPLSCSAPTATIIVSLTANPQTYINTWTLAFNGSGATVSGAADTNTTYPRSLAYSDAVQSCVTFVNSYSGVGFDGNVADVFQDETRDVWSCVAVDNGDPPSYGNSTADETVGCSYGYAVAGSDCIGCK